jgi:hypothetical protein
MRLFSDRQPSACAISSPSTSCPQVQCLGHCGEVADSEADAGIVLKRFVIDAEGGHDWQCVEPSSARVAGQAVEESVVTFARSELEQLLRVCGMKGMSHGKSGVAEVLRMMLRKIGDLGRGNGGCIN